MKKGVSLLACLALLCAMAPLSQAAQRYDQSVVNAMFENARNGEWHRWVHDVGAVENVIAFLEANLEDLENRSPFVATEYYKLGRAGHAHIADHCNDLGRGKVYEYNVEEYKICYSGYNIQRRLGRAVSLQASGNKVYVENILTKQYEWYPSQSEENEAQPGSVSNRGMLAHADYYATISSGSETPLTDQEERIARELDDMLAKGPNVDIGRMEGYLANRIEDYRLHLISERSLAMVFNAYVEALVATGHRELENRDLIWQYIANYRMDGENAFFAVNAILLQPELRSTLTHGQWKTVAAVIGNELMEHRYPENVVAQELARLSMLWFGPADANEYITVAIDRNIEEAKEAARRNGQLAYDKRAAVEKGLQEAYLEFVGGGQALVENATGRHIDLGNEESLAQRRAHAVVETLHDIAADACPGIDAVDAVIAYAARQESFPEQETLSPLANLGALVIYDLDSSLENVRNFSYADARRVVKDFISKVENPRNLE